MKEIYDWVPWFRELAERIANEGEAYLVEKARQVEWGGKPSLLQYGDEAIDPFSFFYFLASKNTSNQLKPVYESVCSVFEIEPLETDIHDGFYFPVPNFNVLFYDEKNPQSSLLWRLFRAAVKDNPKIAPDDFEKILDIKGVGVPKLTQALFLINPGYFQSVDNTIDDLSDVLGLPAMSEIQNEIKKGGGYENYRSFLEKLKDAFPGCQPYEVNMFLYLQNSGSIVVSDDFYQVSSQVMGQGKGDYWDEGELNFKKNNWVYTGGPGDERAYRLADPKPGDIILVRTGREAGKGLGRAIGVVYQNDYAPDGWAEERRIHVLWVNKSDVELAGNTAILGFGKAGSETETYKAFGGIKSYESSFELLKQLRGDSIDIDPQTATGDLQPRADSIEHPHPLNQILYGPPGTGKTWNTVDYALAIIEEKPLDVIERMGRTDKLRRFNKLKESGQIAMVTFHQNYNYEDFIEGIRPVLAGDSEGSVEYELSAGVFRQISERAADYMWRCGRQGDESWDVGELLQAFADWIDEKLESGEEVDLNAVDRKRGTKKIIEIIRLDDETFESVKAGIEDNYRYLTKDIIKRDYTALCNGEINSREEIRPTRESNTAQHSSARYYFALFEKIREFHDNEWQPDRAPQVKKQNYVLIIDEINRGNIAKIFGELITLIEPSKRIGADDETTVTLPYSKDEFGVPDNLYIIGTMNTADRSIALLDTALRRRFDFVEMMPDPTHVPDEIEGVNCQELLKVMNERIRFLHDREHQIGHTYLMNVKSIDSLATMFKNKIVPLLQEYFYDDWEKIELVLNHNGFIEKRDIPEELRAEDQFIDVEKKVYEVLPAGDDKWHDPKSYRAIYEQAKSATEQGS